MEQRQAYRQKGRDEMFKVWHASDRPLIMYIHSDGGSIVCAEKTYPIAKGVLCFIGRGKYHYTMPKDIESYERSKLFLSPAWQGVLWQIMAHAGSLGCFGDGAFVYATLSEQERAEVEAIFERAVLADGDESYGDVLLLACAVELLVYLARGARQSVPASEGFLSLAVEYIHENISGEITVEAICSAAHISKYHFCRCFKQTVGMTVMEYVLKTRLILAKELLKNADVSVTEVGTRCGFGNPAYFSRVFKAEMGLSPLQYRKSVRKEREK